MNEYQTLFLQCLLGAAIVAAAYVLADFILHTWKNSRPDRVASFGLATASIALAWGFLFLGAYSGGAWQTVSAAFSLESIAADPWGSAARLRMATVALGLSAAPWVTVALVRCPPIVF